MSAARLLERTAPPIAATLTRALGATLRLAVGGLDHVVPRWRAGRPLVYAVWHGDLLLVPWLHERLRRTHGARPVAVLVSRSRDGELVAGFVRRFGLEVVRGSTARGSVVASRALARRLARGLDVALTPDGPRGPRQRVQPGVTALAALSGAPVVPLAVAARPARRLATWDAFLLPWPFARCAAVFGPAVTIPRDADRASAAKDVEQALIEAAAAAARLAGA